MSCTLRMSCAPKFLCLYRYKLSVQQQVHKCLEFVTFAIIFHWNMILWMVLAVHLFLCDAMGLFNRQKVKLPSCIKYHSHISQLSQKFLVLSFWLQTTRWLVINMIKSLFWILNSDYRSKDRQSLCRFCWQWNWLRASTVVPLHVEILMACKFKTVSLNGNVKS